MMTRAIPLLLCLSLALAGCSKPELPPVDVSGPQFAPERFDAGARPAPPDVKAIPAAKQASAGTIYEKDLRTWGQSCTNKLSSLKVELMAAGQVSPQPQPTDKSRRRTNGHTP